MDRGAWWTTVHGIAKNQTQLKRLSMHTCNPLNNLMCSGVSSQLSTYYVPSDDVGAGMEQ